MKVLQRQHFRLLLVEDDIDRVEQFRAWLPDWARLVWAQSAGSAIGLIRRDQGHVYGGVLLDHDLPQRAITADDRALSGTDVAAVLVEYFSPDIPVFIHSTNQVQVPRLARQLEGAGFWVTRMPFHELSEKALLEWLEEARAIWRDSTP